MPKNAYINARVEQKLKAQAERVLDKLGVKTSEAITMFLRQVVLHRGLPFDVRLPNSGTRAAIAELDAGGGETFAGDTRELLESLADKRKKRAA